jgi:cytochrome c-type biogenesis protein CcmH/NrfG
VSFKSPYYTSSYLLTWLRRAQQAFPPLLEKPRNFLQATIFFRGSAPATIFLNSSSEPQIKRRSLLSFAALLIFAGLMFEAPAFADSHGKFPGKGNYADWKKAAALAEKAMHLEGQQKSDGIPLLKQAIKIYPFDGKIYFLLANRYRDNTQFVFAKENYAKATQLEPAFSEAWYGLALTLEDTGDSVSAANAYRKATQLKNTYTDAWYNLGVNLFKQQKYTEANQAFNAMLKCPHTSEDEKNASYYLKRIASKALLPSSQTMRIH